MPGILSTIIRLNAPGLQGHLDKAAINLDAQKLLLALVGCESSFGHNTKPRYEKAYDIGGKYYNNALYGKYGWPTAHSLSSLQMMFSTAHELGFDGRPLELSCGWVDQYINGEGYWEHGGNSNGGDWICCPLACEFWRLRVIEKGHKSLEDFPDAYNSGSVGGFVPTDYIKKFVDFYGQNLKWLEGQCA